jgi:hypothetical protein
VAARHLCVLFTCGRLFPKTSALASSSSPLHCNASISDQHGRTLLTAIIMPA